MKTIKEITDILLTIEEPNTWTNSLRADARIGVQTALARWERGVEKRIMEKKAFDDKIQFDSSFAPFMNALVAGVDEAGRGPLAGPVVTAAVILPPNPIELIGLDDSKTLSKVTREGLANKIRTIAIATSVHIQTAKQIDQMNIYAATRDSMEKAVQTLTVKPDIVLADAMNLQIACQTASIIKGDAQSLAIAAASILAKTTRDELMEQYHQEYPQYNFKQNAGYGTAEHLLAIEQYGPCMIHRKTFEPIKSMLLQGV